MIRRIGVNVYPKRPVTTKEAYPKPLPQDIPNRHPGQTGLDWVGTDTHGTVVSGAGTRGLGTGCRH